MIRWQFRQKKKLVSFISMYLRCRGAKKDTFNVMQPQQTRFTPDKSYDGLPDIGIFLCIQHANEY